MLSVWALITAALLGGAAPTPPHYERGERAGMMVIPRLDLEAPIREGTGHAVLDHAIGHSRRSDWPGEGGDVITWAHNVTPTLGLPHGPFHETDRLRPGDPIIIRMSYGFTQRYRVVRHYIVPVEEIPAFFTRHHDGRLYLSRCYPDGSTAFRYVVLAKREEGS